jgi:hypothetical protein
MVKTIIILVVLVAVAAYFLYRFLRRPVVSGTPEEVPKLVSQMTEKLEQMTTKIIHPLKSTEDASTDNRGNDNRGNEDHSPPVEQQKEG